MTYGNALNRCSINWTRQKRPAGRGRMLALSWMHSFSAIAPAVSGTTFQVCMETMPLSIALSNTGDDWGCLHTSGPSLRKLRTGLIEECEELGQVDWEWQSADTAMGKARSGGDQIGPNPTDRAKNGSKRSILTDGGGGPLAAVVTGANVHDTKLLDQTIEAIVVERPEATEAQPQHLCLDKGYDNPTGEAAVNKHGYVGHIRRIGEEKLEAGQKKHPARRWVVERTLGWLSKCRGILVRYEKKAENYLALVQFACALLWYRRLAYQSF